MGIESHQHDRENGGCPMIMLVIDVYFNKILTATHKFFIQKFHGGVCETNFFNSWTTKTVGPFVGVAFLIFFVAILFEGLKFLREKYYEEELKAEQNLPSSDRKKTFTKFLCNKYHLVQTLMHFLQVTCSYGLMLIFMNFNYYQCLAILLGFTVGYFIFGWVQKSATDKNECCY